MDKIFQIYQFVNYIGAIHRDFPSSFRSIFVSPCISFYTDMNGELDASVLQEGYPNYREQIEHIEVYEEEAAETVSPEKVLPSRIADKLEFDLYTHQAEALGELDFGENVCVSTSTSSGKTMVYALHFARTYLQDPTSTGLIIYPTKALSRDQKVSLTKLYNDELELDISVQVYDGDTPREERPEIRENADIIITNFAGINHYLPHHSKWSSFFGNLSLLALDESHTYTGVHGMHVAWIIRRLKRIVDYYNTTPQYVLTSATIGNPAEHSRVLTGEEVFIIDDDGSPSGKRTLIYWNPPAWSENEKRSDGTINRKPASVESSEVLAHLAANNIQTLQFASSRKMTELTAHRAEEQLEDENTPYSSDVEIEAYHAGHGKETRRETEDRLKDGDIDAVVSTEALELGIDIGGVDGTVIAGYPGTRQSFWQQIGRSGRGASEALSVFIADYDSIDQYLINNPHYLSEDYVEDAVVDLDNNEVYSQHILCAANELALTEEDKEYFEEDRLERAIAMWKKAGELVGGLKTGVQYSGTGRPEANVSLYASSDEQFEVRLHAEADDDLDMEPVDKDRAYRDFHKGAIYMHKGQRYEVVKFVDQGSQKYILLRPAHNINYYTRSKSETRITNVTPKRSRDIGDFTLYWGEGTVTAHYEFFDKIDIDSSQPQQRNIPTGLPPLNMKTQMLWLEIPDYVEEGLISKYADYEATHQPNHLFNGYMGGMHAVEHGMINVAPLELMMDKQDLGGLSTFSHPAYDTSGFFIYDGISGGLGFSRTIYDQFEEIAIRTRELIASCECTRERGCPACVMDDNCGDQNSPLHKSCAIDLIDHLIGEANKEKLEPYLSDGGVGSRRAPLSYS